MTHCTAHNFAMAVADTASELDFENVNTEVELESLSLHQQRDPSNVSSRKASLHSARASEFSSNTIGNQTENTNEILSGSESPGNNLDDIGGQNTVRKIQYIVFSLVSVACAITVMLIWYSVWKSNNQTSTKNLETTIEPAGIISGTCPVWELVGDGVCDYEANNPECGYDFKDCCSLENDRSLCPNCTCILSEDSIESYKVKDCLKFLQFNMYIGNGFCHPHFNSANFFFDAGDCCLDDPVCVGNATEIPCPESPCILSNSFCIPEELGDGICQDHNNGPYCDMDSGDCCLPDADDTQCCLCSCREFQYWG